MGFNCLYMANLNAWRTHDPRQIPRDPVIAVGPENEHTLLSLTKGAELIVAAWGNHKLNGQAQALASQILALPNTRALGFNKKGSPRHSLYVRAGSPLLLIAKSSAATSA